VVGLFSLNDRARDVVNDVPISCKIESTVLGNRYLSMMSWMGRERRVPPPIRTRSDSTRGWKRVERVERGERV
jgi:hypothetical protein